MEAANRDAVGDKCVENDNGQLAVTDDETSSLERTLSKTVKWVSMGKELASYVTNLLLGHGYK